MTRRIHPLFALSVLLGSGWPAPPALGQPRPWLELVPADHVPPALPATRPVTPAPLATDRLTIWLAGAPYRQLARPVAGVTRGRAVSLAGQRFWPTVTREMSRSPQNLLLPDLPAPATFPRRLIVVTTLSLLSRSHLLERYLAWKEASGWQVILGLEQDWDRPVPEDGDDRPARIRGWLRQVVQAQGPGYLLLVGDPTPDLGDVPMRRTEPLIHLLPYIPWDLRLSLSAVPTDHYYADLESSWDCSGNGVFGEYPDDLHRPDPAAAPGPEPESVDLGPAAVDGGGPADQGAFAPEDAGLDGGVSRDAGSVSDLPRADPGCADWGPELIVGRIPVYGGNTVALDRILARTLAWEQAPDKSWRGRILLAGAFGGFRGQPATTGLGIYDDDDDMGSFLDRIGRDLEAAYGLPSFRLFEDEGLVTSALPHQASLTQAAFLDVWSQGYGAVAWGGHGSPTGVYRLIWWQDEDGNARANGSNEVAVAPLVEAWETRRLVDAPPAIVHAMSCENGHPEDPGNLGATLLLTGAVATATASRSTVGVTSPYWEPAPELGCAETNSYYFNLQLHGGRSAGEALAFTKYALPADGWAADGGGSPWDNGFGWLVKLQYNLYGDPTLGLERCTGEAGCDDGLLCNGIERCVDGYCVRQAIPDCQALDSPCTRGVCDPATDSCVARPRQDGVACDDGSWCTLADRCQAGQCAGEPRTCPEVAGLLSRCDDESRSCVTEPRPPEPDDLGLEREVADGGGPVQADSMPTPGPDQGPADLGTEPTRPDSGGPEPAVAQPRADGCSLGGVRDAPPAGLGWLLIVGLLLRGLGRGWSGRPARPRAGWLLVLGLGAALGPGGCGATEEPVSPVTGPVDASPDVAAPDAGNQGVGDRGPTDLGGSPTDAHADTMIESADATGIEPDPDAGEPTPEEPGGAFFEAVELSILELTLTPADRQRLRDAPHEPVIARLLLRAPLELQEVLVGVRVAAQEQGRRTIDERPHLELDFTLPDPRGQLQGLHRLELDNLLRDWSLIRRWLASQLYRALGVAAPRVGYAWLRLDGEDYGLYAAVEVVDADWLARHLPATGHLYAGESGRELTSSQLEGFPFVYGDPGPRDDLQQLVALIEQPPGDGWFAALDARLDWEAVLTLLAIEQCLGNLDGYGQRRTSYWLHADTAGRFRFLPGDPTSAFTTRLPVRQVQGLLLARCLLDASCRARFDQTWLTVRARLAEVGPEWLAAEQVRRLLAWAVIDGRLEWDERYVSWGLSQITSFLLQQWEDGNELNRCLRQRDNDADRDGFRCDGDCDEADPATHLGALDRCDDGRDQDCNGWPDDGPGCPDCTALWRGPHRYLVCTRARSWTQARQACEELGSALAVIDDAGEQTWLRRAAWAVREQAYWIGLHDEAEEGRFVWSDGQAAGYTAWAGGQPDDAGGREDCVHFLAGSGLWNDLPCESGLGMLCEDPCPPGQDADEDGALRCGGDCDDDDAALRPGLPDECGNELDEDCSGLADDGPGCDCTELGREPYRYLVCTTPRSWNDARAYCQQLGLDLATIDDPEENRWLHQAAIERLRQYYWIGLSDQAEEGQFRWCDGQEPGFTHWQYGEPNDAGGAEDCAHFWSDVPTWNDNQCGAALGVLCRG